MKRFLVSMIILAVLTLAVGVIPVRAETTTYTVQAGDTLLRIAARYGITVSELAAANGLSWSSWVYVGQRLTIPTRGAAQPAPVSSGATYLVRAGDTLVGIAARHGVSASALAAANGISWNSWVYIGQRLVIPGPGTTPVPAPQPPPSASGGTHIVQAGNTLFSIARQYGTTVSAIQVANGLSSSTIYVGQRLRIPAAGTTPVSPAPQPPSAPPASHGLHGEKWIDVNLTTQRVTAYEGRTPVYSALASTGTWRTPTVVGTFQIYVKYVSTRMSGPGYDLPNVPYTMYFYRGYGIHGTYWHNNFGTPMSHGCVNLSTPDAQWFFNWAPVGTKVVTHY